MIAHLKGKILKKTDKGIILDTGNVGYYVNLSASKLAEIHETNDCQFFIYSNVREDAFDLYGFTNYEELGFFKNLISINGIGPKVAMEILNSPSDKIKSAIVNEDAAFICKIPGIGQKTAKRIILELKGKIEVESLPEEYQSAEINNDVMDALLKLGYQRQHISRTLNGLPEELIEAEEIITYFLKNN